MTGPLYPLVLIIETPHGTVDFVTHQPPPTALVARRIQAATRKVALSGQAIVNFPSSAEGWELTLAVSERTGVPLPLALPLQACTQGELVTITENLTKRDTLRVWEGAVVTEPDSGAWITGNPRGGDWFTVQMQFFVLQE